MLYRIALCTGLQPITLNTDALLLLQQYVFAGRFQLVYHLFRKGRAAECEYHDVGLGA